MSITRSTEVEKAVLRHPEGIPGAIICAVLLVIMARLLVSITNGHRSADVVYLLFLWVIGVLAILVFFLWSIAGVTIVQKRSERLTMSLALGPLRWEIRSVFLADLKSVVARERVYGNKGTKIPRYEILYGKPGAQKELIGFLTKENAALLVHGILREFLDRQSAL